MDGGRGVGVRRDGGWGVGAGLGRARQGVSKVADVGLAPHTP